MTKQEFQNLVKQDIVILDGATGSNLMKAGMPRGVCTEQWICDNPEAITRLQKAYQEAGSQIVYAPTFSANAISLQNHGLEKHVRDLNLRLVDISRQAVGDSCLIAGDLTTTGKQELPYEKLLGAYREQIEALMGSRSRPAGGRNHAGSDRAYGCAGCSGRGTSGYVHADRGIGRQSVFRRKYL